MHTKKRWIWTNTTLIMAFMLGVDYKYDCTTVPVTSIQAVYYFYVHLLGLVGMTFKCTCIIYT